MRPTVTARNLADDGETTGEGRRRDILTDAVRREVIPRLLERHEIEREQPVVSDAQVVELADLALYGLAEAAVAFVTALLTDGVPAERLYLDLLTPSAALLGEYWESDVCNFADVTIGLVNLQSALRALGPSFFEGHPLPSQAGPRVLLLPMPGEQHTFGLRMLADFFLRAGFNTWTGQVADTAELRELVQTEWVDLLGFTIGCNEMLDVARREIETVRRASRNRSVVIMVGGPPLLHDPGLGLQIGADGTAKNGLEAVEIATAILRRRPSRA